MSEENKLYLDNGQEVVLKNPGTAGLEDFLIIAKSLSKVPKDVDEKDFMSYFESDTITSVKNLINLTIKKTFPEVTEEIDAWAMQNSMLILPKVIEMCSPKQSKDEKAREELLAKVTG